MKEHHQEIRLFAYFLVFLRIMPQEKQPPPPQGQFRKGTDSDVNLNYQLIAASNKWWPLNDI